MRDNDTDDPYPSHDWQSIQDISEIFTETPQQNPRPGSLKRKAAAYLGPRDPNKQLNKPELRQLLNKAKKMKTSSKKEERAKGIQLEKQVQQAFNFRT